MNKDKIINLSKNQVEIMLKKMNEHEVDELYVREKPNPIGQSVWIASEKFEEMDISEVENW